MAITGLTDELKQYFSGMNPPKVSSSAPATATLGNDSAQANPSFTPTSSIEDDPMKYRYISYPRDVTQDMANGHYMLFYVNVQNKAGYGYTGEDGQPVGSVVEYEVQQGNPHSDAESSGKFGYARQASDPIGYQDAFNRVAKGGKGNILKEDEIFLTPNSRYQQSKYGQSGGVNSTFKTTTRITDSVALYLPPNVQDSTSAGYNDAQTGIVGLVAAGGGQFLDAMRRNDYQAAASQLIGGVKAISEEALIRSSAGIVDLLSGGEGDTLGLANKVFGQATNPYMEVLFDSMAFRNFTYNFTFAPKNAQERDDVQDIIKLFRFHMAPELKGAQHRFLTLPSTFDIHYMYQHSKNYASENNFYSKIATCVLKDVTVDYTPNGVKSFQDGSPTQINMSLSFQETEILTKQSINAGY
tara:strand:+ start:59 stop:1294 length:1236 start_codon:yes stop_codon:yes gene_type:complete